MADAIHAAKVLLAGVMLTGALCMSGCFNARDVDASPECPDGRQASVRLTLIGDLDGIRPIDGDADLQVRGHRESVEPCVEADALSAFLVHLQTDRGETETVPKLAPGQWTIHITSLSGGEHREVIRKIELSPGGSALLVVKTTKAGLVVR